MHVLFAIATDVVDVDVEHVGVLLHLPAGHRHQAVPVFLRQQFAHLAAAAGVELLANDQERIVLVIRRDAVDRCSGGLVIEAGAHIFRAGAIPAAGTFSRLELLSQFRQADVGRSSTAATTDHLHTEVLNEVHELHLQLHRREAVMSYAANVFRQSGIGNAADGEGGMFGEIADVLLHLLRTGGAVQAEDVDRERLKDRHHSGDIRADEHGAGGLHRDGDHQGPPLTGGGKGLFDALSAALICSTS